MFNRNCQQTLREKKSLFLHYICASREELEERFIINMVETPLYFDIVPGTCVDKKGPETARSHHRQ